jgi:hypothetical protein
MVSGKSAEKRMYAVMPTGIVGVGGVILPVMQTNAARHFPVPAAILA